MKRRQLHEMHGSKPGAVAYAVFFSYFAFLASPCLAPIWLTVISIFGTISFALLVYVAFFTKGASEGK